MIGVDAVTPYLRRGASPVRYVDEETGEIGGGFSPSQFSLAFECWRHWCLNYPHGQKAEEKPTRAKTLGAITHACLESWACGGSIYTPDVSDRKDVQDYEALHGKEALAELFADAPRRAIMCIPHVPHGVRYPEVIVDLDVQALRPGARWELSAKSSADLVTVYAMSDGSPAISLVDYKTCSSWKYLPTPEDLAINVQLLTYCAWLFQEYPEVDEIKCTWIYTITKGAPSAKPVKVTVSREHVASAIVPWLDLADRMVDYYDTVAKDLDRGELVIHIATLPPPEDLGACRKYEGCPHRMDRGRLCKLPDVPLSALARRSKSMPLFDRVKTLTKANDFRAPEALAAAAAADTTAPAIAVPEVEPAGPTTVSTPKPKGLRTKKPMAEVKPVVETQGAEPEVSPSSGVSDADALQALRTLKAYFQGAG